VRCASRLVSVQGAGDSLWHTTDVSWRQSMSALSPHIDLLGYGERVTNLDSEIADRDPNLHMASKSWRRFPIFL